MFSRVAWSKRVGTQKTWLSQKQPGPFIPTNPPQWIGQLSAIMGVVQPLLVHMKRAKELHGNEHSP